MKGKIIKRQGIGSHTVVLVEKHSDFMKILSEQGNNVFSAGVETHNFITYFRIMLKKDTDLNL